MDPFPEPKVLHQLKLSLLREKALSPPWRDGFKW
jgi:hypothetical protein